MCFLESFDKEDLRSISEVQQLVGHPALQEVGVQLESHAGGGGGGGGGGGDGAQTVHGEGGGGHGAAMQGGGGGGQAG